MLSRHASKNMNASVLIPLHYVRGTLELLDQRLLPHEHTYLPVKSQEDVWNMIKVRISTLALIIDRFRKVIR